MQITPILRKIEHYLDPQLSIAVSRLQEGLSNLEIEQKTAHLSYSLSPEVLQLYAWKNGGIEESGNTIGELLLFQLGIFQPLETSLEHYAYNTVEGFWGKKHFPLFTTGGGDFLLINLDQHDPSFGYIFEHSFALHYGELIPSYKSLQTLLECVLECYEKGAYSFADGALRQKTALRDPIIKKYRIPY